MPHFDPGSPPRRGDVLTADRLARLEAEVRRLGSIRGGGGVDVRQTAGGIAFTGVRQADRYVALATSDFATRSSSTVSSGSVDLWWLVDDAAGAGTGTIEAAGISLDTVWCCSSTETSSGSGISIASGTYCVVFQDPFSTWWAEPSECPP